MKWKLCIHLTRILSNKWNMYVQDLVSVVMLSLPCGWICTLVGLPPMFGYIVCGVLLGPSGLNSIKVCVIVVSASDLKNKTLYLFTFCASRSCQCLCPAVYGPGGDSGGVGCVLHSLCGGIGVLTRAPSKGKQEGDSY